MSNEWMTPADIFHRLNVLVGGFEIDAAANGGNSLCEKWYGPGSPLAEDALEVKEWESPAFCNPPYKLVRQFTKKFAEQMELGKTIIAILPARTGTKWWREGVVNPMADIAFMTGRIAFLDPLSSDRAAPNHDSAIVIYSPESSGKVTWINRD